MRKLRILSVYFCSVFIVGILFAEVRVQEMIRGYIRPATSSSAVTIAAAGAGFRNCLTDLTVISNSTYTVRILNGNSTDYALLMGASSGLIKEWNVDNMFCGNVNQAMTVSVDNGTYSINYQGLVINK